VILLCRKRKSAPDLCVCLCCRPRRSDLKTADELGINERGQQLHYQDFGGSGPDISVRQGTTVQLGLSKENRLTVARRWRELFFLPFLAPWTVNTAIELHAAPCQGWIFTPFRAADPKSALSVPFDRMLRHSLHNPSLTHRPKMLSVSRSV
jgi:hypothetical protein